MFDEVVTAEDCLQRAVQVAELVPDDCLEAFAFTKRATQAAALRDIADLSDALDVDLPDGMTAASSRRAHRRSWYDLKGHEPTW